MTDLPSPDVGGRAGARGAPLVPEIARMPAATLARRLDRLRLERTAGEAQGSPIRRQATAPQPAPQVTRLADALAGSWVATDAGGYIRVDGPPSHLPLDRDRLAGLPGFPPPDVPLVCLDTETTGLATGAGTIAFLVGIGVWQRDGFRPIQLLMTDHSDEPALLDALAASIPPDSWLVSYNGRGFDWPLLVSRFRMARRQPPLHAGHLDLLPLVRRVYRHRMSDARLRTVEIELLGLDRGPDVDGWEIPGRFFAFLRGGPVEPLVEVVRHNREDVVSLARLLAHTDDRLGDGQRRRAAPVGDLVGLAAVYRGHGRPAEALECLDAALEAPSRTVPASSARIGWTALLTRRADALDAPHSGGPSRDGLLLERARLLRRVGRHDEALTAWRDLALAGGPTSGEAWIEVAKVLEHRHRDPAAALHACLMAAGIAERARQIGRPLPGLEADLGRRRHRLIRRASRAELRAAPNAGGSGRPPKAGGSGVAPDAGCAPAICAPMAGLPAAATMVGRPRPTA